MRNEDAIMINLREEDSEVIVVNYSKKVTKRYPIVKNTLCQKIEIYCPLSYGDEVISYEKDRFGRNFIP